MTEENPFESKEIDVKCDECDNGGNDCDKEEKQKKEKSKYFVITQNDETELSCHDCDKWEDVQALADDEKLCVMKIIRGKEIKFTTKITLAQM